MGVRGTVLKAAERILLLQGREKYESNLLDFSEYVWPVVEPAIPFIKGWVIEAIAEHLEAVASGDIRRLLINVPPGFTKSLLTDVFFPAWLWGPKNRPHMRFLCAAYSEHLTVRDNMRCRSIIISDRYQKLWGNRFKVSTDQFTKIKFANSETGWKLATSVGGIGTGERADIVIVDDPNNPMEMESEPVRDTTKMWFTEILPDRLNNQILSSIIVIQQRTHQEDVSGLAISREMGYEHLMIPMEYDIKRHCHTSIGWEDPRTEDGEIAWPERFPGDIVSELARDKGIYAYCNPGEAPVLMEDLSLRRIDQVNPGDKIVGFTIGNKDKRARLRRAEVLRVSKVCQPIVRITLDSGEVIRCTRNHKWWTARNDKSHPPYSPARIGSTLSRICPATLPVLTPTGECLAGWVAGFFDGEGTVSVNKRREGESSPLIGFSQGTGRNAPLCSKLESALSELGFNYGIWDRDSGKEHKLRFYWLKMSEAGRASRLPLYQRFLHVVQPVKWRERILDLATSGRLYTTGERVVSIDDDGVETAYGLETTTGNYVVWGLASSNSAQYQQLPAPRGGGIIKEEYWQLWKGDNLPGFSYILASLDTAYTAKDGNDYSALTVWGVFHDEEEPIDVGSDVLWQPRSGAQVIKPAEGRPRLMLLWAWRERLEFFDLVQKVIETCVRGSAPKGVANFPVDKLLIESRASGISVAQELHRLFRATGKIGIELINPTPYGDKVARAYSIQHLFSDGMVYAPDRNFADMVIEECAMFTPMMTHSHDDLVDSVTMALRYLRDCGFVLRRDEYAIEKEDELMYKSPNDNRPLYPV